MGATEDLTGRAAGPRRPLRSRWVPPGCWTVPAVLLLLLGIPADYGGGESRAAVATSSEPTTEELRALIPPEFRPDRRAVPEDENAAGPLLEMMGRGTAPAPEVRAALRAVAVWEVPIPTDSDADVRTVRSWLLANTESMELMRSAARRRGCLFPVPSVTQPGAGLSVLMPVSYGLLSDARLRWRDGMRADAITAIEDVVSVSGHMTQGARTLIEYLVGSSIQRLALEAVAAAALRPECSAADLRRLAGILSRAPDAAAEFRACLRSELADFIVPAARLDVVRANFAGVHTNTLLLELYPEELHRPLELVLDPRLLACHPKPFDAARAVRDAIGHWTEVDRRVAPPWSMDPLPDHTEATRERFVADFAPVEEALEDEELPLSDEAVARVAPLFVKVEDPVGRLLASLPQIVGPLHQRVFDTDTRWRAVGAVVAIRRWAVDHGGASPDSLQALVDASLLSQPPTDAFSGKPLHYSARRGLLWSVGPNARDDEGRRDKGSDGDADDPSWAVTRTPAP